MVLLTKWLSFITINCIVVALCNTILYTVALNTNTCSNKHTNPLKAKVTANLRALRSIKTRY